MLFYLQESIIMKLQIPKGVNRMNSWERFKRMYDHREADRIPIIDDPWAGTLRRWKR